MPGKNAQLETLISYNDELENYFRNTIIPQLYVDGEFRLQKFTPPAMKQFSLSLSDLGKSISEIKDNFRFPSIVENIQQVIDSNEILEKEIQTTDLRWYQMNVIPYLKLQDKKTDGVIITFVEITARINDLKEQEKLIADHETLLDTIAHDIKNPLSNLIMVFDRFKTISLANEKEFKDHLEIVDRALAKMSKLINELTDTRKEGPKYKPEEELLSFENVLEDVRLILSESISQNNAILTTDIQVSELTFSRRKLRSILFNLVNNAIKFHAPGTKPEISISTRLENGYTVISVKDNGIGIDPAMFEKIFSKYYRVENKIEGSGVGLYLVKEMVKQAGGKVELESKLGEGSTFRIYLKNG